MDLVDQQPSNDALRALGDFLRAKRRLLRPGRAGSNPNRRRLAPGLSRDEVAAIADIGTTWYARLEAGRIAKPTLATIRAVSTALELDSAESGYVLQLAGLIPRTASVGLTEAALTSLASLVDGPEGVALSLSDRYLTPLGCNAVADAMFGHSEIESAVERHPITRLPHARTLDFFGPHYEDYARNLVGMFRRAYIGSTPPPHAQEVFAIAETIPIFNKYWDQHVVANFFTADNSSFVRNHWMVGTYTATAVDLIIDDEETRLRIVAPADDVARSKFTLLAAAGTSSLTSLTTFTQERLKNGSAIILTTP